MRISDWSSDVCSSDLREILAVRRRMQETGESPERAVVRLVLADGTEYPEAGHIDFADVTVSQSTDSLTVRAEFPNPNRVLVDGQFTRVMVAPERPDEALVIRSEEHTSELQSLMRISYAV